MPKHGPEIEKLVFWYVSRRAASFLWAHAFFFKCEIEQIKLSTWVTCRLLRQSDQNARPNYKNSPICVKCATIGCFHHRRRRHTFEWEKKKMLKHWLTLKQDKRIIIYLYTYNTNTWQSTIHFHLISLRVLGRTAAWFLSSVLIVFFFNEIKMKYISLTTNICRSLWHLRNIYLYLIFFFWTYLSAIHAKKSVIRHFFFNDHMEMEKLSFRKGATK